MELLVAIVIGLMTAAAVYLLLRGRSHLYCLSESPRPRADSDQGR